MSFGKVSVIIPCYNNNFTIRETVDSILAQTYKNLEVIVVDNGMTLDKNLLMTDGRLPDRVVVVESEKQLGAYGGRNLGVIHATGRYIAFCDADDLWNEEKLAMQLAVMTRFRVKGKAPVLVFTGRELINENGEPLDKYIGCQKVVSYKRLLRTNQISCSSVLMERKIALANPFPDVDFHEDYALWLRLLSNGNYAAGINRPLISYRVSTKSKSGNKIKSAIMTYKVYKYIGLKPIDRMYYMFTYTVNGIKKYA